MTSLENYQKLKASHRALLDALVQLLEEFMYPIDIPHVESIIAIAEQLEKEETP